MPNMSATKQNIVTFMKGQSLHIFPIKLMLLEVIKHSNIQDSSLPIKLHSNTDRSLEIASLSLQLKCYRADVGAFEKTVRKQNVTLSVSSIVCHILRECVRDIDINCWNKCVWHKMSYRHII